MSEESPTLEEPTVEEPEVKEESVDEIQGLVTKLEELGIDSIDKVDSVVRASQESGNLARLLGEERKARAEAERRLMETQNQRVNLDNDDYGVDLGKVVRNEMENFWDNKQKAALQQQQAQMRQYNKIRSHKSYPIVKDKFEEYIKTPDYQEELMSGKSPEDIFHEMKDNELIGYLKVMKNAVASKSIAPENVSVPHTETSQATPPAIEPDNEKNEKLKNAKKNWKGDDSDLEKVLDILL